LQIFGIKIPLRKEALLSLVLILAAILCLTGYFITRNNGGIIIDAADTESSEEETEADEADAAPAGSRGDEAESPEDIKVYVVGCVKNPGIVTLKKGQLIDDAIMAAGGATEDADLENINLVYRLKDNVMLRVYSREDAQQRDGVGEAGPGIGITGNDGGSVTGVESSRDSAGSLVNINTAGQDELETLPGIGESTARDIIAYREKNGAFRTIRDIMKVPGIKEGRFETIKAYITAE
jgi:competence protein ComEA